MTTSEIAEELKIEQIVKSQNLRASIKFVVYIAVLITAFVFAYFAADELISDDTNFVTDVSVADGLPETIDLIGLIDTQEIEDNVSARVLAEQESTKPITGSVEIPAGTNSIEVVFAATFEETPKIFLTPVGYLGNFTVINPSESGFTIQIPDTQGFDVGFNWMVVR